VWGLWKLGQMLGCGQVCVGFVEVESDVRMWAGLVGLCGVCGNWVRYQDVDRISSFVWGLWKLGKISGCGQD